MQPQQVRVNYACRACEVGWINTVNHRDNPTLCWSCGQPTPPKHISQLAYEVLGRHLEVNV